MLAEVLFSAEQSYSGAIIEHLLEFYVDAPQKLSTLTQSFHKHLSNTYYVISMASNDRNTAVS